MGMTTNKWANQYGEGKLTDKKTSVWGNKLLGGTAGLTLTARQIVDLMSYLSGDKEYKTYCEPFAGKARTWELLQENWFQGEWCLYKPQKEGKIVLNDLSRDSNRYCKEKYPYAIVEYKKFEATIPEYDSEKTFFMIDPPWRKKIYTNNDFFVCPNPIPYYYNTCLDFFDTIKGDWVICSAADEHECRGVLTKSKWNTIIIKSNAKKKIFGKPARTLICSNLIPRNLNGIQIETSIAEFIKERGYK